MKNTDLQVIKLLYWQQITKARNIISHEKVTVSPGLKGAWFGVLLGTSVVTPLITDLVMSGQPPERKLTMISYR